MSESSRTPVLLIVDMINPLDFPGGASMRPLAIEAAKRLARLKKRFRDSGHPVVYVNDNFMDWQADFKEIVAVVGHDTPGAPLAELLAPEHDDYFVLKPKHSGFYETPLPTLLEKLQAGRLVVTGVATDGCVLATATDAHIREFDVHVPRDCVAAISTERTERALALMKASMHIDVRTSRYVDP